jgi:L-alanine-DL-glutamate epimerase-like enolase superfamily enzyme
MRRCGGRQRRGAIRERKLPTLLADGESGAGDGDLLELIRAGIVTVSQPDIRRLGIFAYRDYAERIRPFGGLIAAHAKTVS